MGELVEGDDGLLVEEVGPWAKDKSSSLCRYIDISRAVRAKWIGPSKGGATYIDLFCGPGRSMVRRTKEYLDGSCVAAWKASKKGAPFSQIYIADLDPVRRGYAAERLRRLSAPVVEIKGDAVTAAKTIRNLLNPRGLHFCFVDPYSLGAFNFGILQTFAGLRYIDILVHISKMDLQRNVGVNIATQRTAFDSFAPGWRDAVSISQQHQTVRREVFEFWRKKVEGLGISASAAMELITGSNGQHLYWLTLMAKHDIAHKFWKTASNKGQGELF